ncbi:MAG: hypothetical protein ACRDZ9_01690, partial [Acidimicrobiales bacterium]
SDIGVAAQHARLTVTRPGGQRRPMPSFVITTDGVSIQPLEPGASLHAETRLFWSTNGFAFDGPGKHRVGLEVAWAQDGVGFGVGASTDVWVGYPQSSADNDAAALLLDDQVGMYVALGGDAPHLTDALSRLWDVAATAGEGDVAPPRALRGFDGLMPAPATVDVRAPEREPVGDRARDEARSGARA